MGAGVIERLLIDNSAWSRLTDRRVPVERLDEVAAAVESGRLHVCTPFVLEAGYSARGASDHEMLLAELRALPWAAMDDAVQQSAIAAQRELARAGHHRMPPVDLLIAAVADANGLGVLHYDHDFDVIAARTSLDFRSEWLVAPGSL